MKEEKLDLYDTRKLKAIAVKNEEVSFYNLAGKTPKLQLRGCQPAPIPT